MPSNNPLDNLDEFFDGKDPVTWFLEWTIHFDWEDIFRKGVTKYMAMTSEDWAKIWGPLAAAFVAEMVKAMPAIIAALLAAFGGMSGTEKAETIKAIASVFSKPQMTDAQ